MQLMFKQRFHCQSRLPFQFQSSSYTISCYHKKPVGTSLIIAKISNGERGQWGSDGQVAPCSRNSFTGVCTCSKLAHGWGQNRKHKSEVVSNVTRKLPRDCGASFPRANRLQLIGNSSGCARIYLKASESFLL